MRYFIYLSYDGKSYHGWQIQPNANSVQAELMRALSLLFGTETEVIGAGRTDTEVNARLMVAHFDCNAQIIERMNNNEHAFENWLTHKLNRMIPSDISVQNIIRVNDDVHARFSAISRTYQYHVVTKRDPFSRHYSYYYPHPLDFGKMNEAAKHLFDYTDFTSFSKLHTDVKTNNCKIQQAEWKQIKNNSDTNIYATSEWVFTIKADRFLRNMVRAIVGTLIDIGRGNMSIEEFCNLIEKRDRCSAGNSVPGNALFLTDIEYPVSINPL